MEQFEIYVFMRERNTLEFINDMPEFNIVIFKEFAACRYIIKKVFD